MIKAVLFDLWNTLAHSTNEWREAYDEAGYHKSKEHDEIFENKINTRAYVDEEELADYMCSCVVRCIICFNLCVYSISILPVRTYSCCRG